jgi:diguanylate cyclase (GGDEF)-like protein/PAS domain S-box-containing protein
MKNKFLTGLSFKLTKSTVSIAFVLGLLVSLLQLYSDFDNQAKLIDDKVEEIFSITAPAAQRAVHQLDPGLASELVNGLSHFDFLNQVKLVDDRKNILASFVRQPVQSNTYWLSNLFGYSTETYLFDLINNAQVSEGELILEVNGDAAMAPFFQRAWYVLLFGVLRNLLLGLLLSVVFQNLLAIPLMKLRDQLNKIDPKQPAGYRLEHMRHHDSGEISDIVDTTNSLLNQLEINQSALRENRDQLKALIDVNPNIVMALDRDLTVLFANNSANLFYGVKAEQILGANFLDLHRGVNSQEADRFAHELIQVIHNLEESYEVERELTDGMARKRVLQISYTAIVYEGHASLLLVASDMTEKITREKQLIQVAYQDQLTGLPNRELFLDRLGMAITYTASHKQYGALLYIDLDEFRLINDSKGHSVGDSIILALSDRLASKVNSSNTLARIGGDEFCIILTGVDDDKEAALTKIVSTAELILSDIRQPLQIKGNEFRITASIGVVIFSEEDSDAEELFKFGDTAMYNAKSAGRNRISMFKMEMTQEVASYVRLENDLKSAIENKEFEFYLQPIVCVGTNQIRGAEALIRWNHPEKGLIGPNEFIDFLESSGLICDISDGLLRDLCAFINERDLLSVLPDGFRIALNVSAIELHSKYFIETFKATLRDYSMPADLFELEITESSAIQDIEESVAKMKKLALIGVNFSLDDFGTGYSSLSYLKRLPVNKIKIDRSFIQDLIIDHNDQALVTAIISIGRHLNLNIVAEGVEWQAQLDWLKQHTMMYQGYLFSKPIKQQDFYQLLMENLAEKLNQSCSDSSEKNQSNHSPKVL